MTKIKEGFPLVNLNGSSVGDLIEERLNAWRSIQVTMKAFQVIRPHGRDYQTASAKSYDMARARYDAQFASLDKLANEIMDEVNYLQNQVHK